MQRCKCKNANPKKVETRGFSRCPNPGFGFGKMSGLPGYPGFSKPGFQSLFCMRRLFTSTFYTRLSSRWSEMLLQLKKQRTDSGHSIYDTAEVGIDSPLTGGMRMTVLRVTMFTPSRAAETRSTSGGMSRIWLGPGDRWTCTACYILLQPATALHGLITKASLYGRLAVSWRGTLPCVICKFKICGEELLWRITKD